MNITRARFLTAFVVGIALLAVGRRVARGTASGVSRPAPVAQASSLRSDVAGQPSQAGNLRHVRGAQTASLRYSDIPHPIYSVPSFKDAFPDSQSVQIAAAQRWGISPVANRKEAERRRRDLVYLTPSHFYTVDKMGKSIPYVVPRAAILLQDLGRAFFDSLYIKGVPLHKFIITSATRTRDDIQRLRTYNGNATENSCHLYGTTVDICYNRYRRVQDPDGPRQRTVRDDTLKWILSEVLRDFRTQKRCHVKYEVKQGCFHLTVD